MSETLTVQHQMIYHTNNELESIWKEAVMA
jgi:hypothetical protein